MHYQIGRTDETGRIVAQAERIFMALRKDGLTSARGRMPAFHAVTPFCRMALCATEPGAASAWAEPPSDAVTCRICLAKLKRLNATVQPIRSKPRYGL